MTEKKDEPAAAPVQKLAPVPEPKPECPVTELRLYASHVNTFVHEVEHGVSLEEVCRPGYWKNVWRQLARAKWTEIVAIAVDGTWEARLRVISAGDGFAKVRVIFQWEAERKRGRPAGLPEGWTTEFVSGGWRVRNADNEMVTDKHTTEGEAIEVARKLMAKLGA